jgi:hypothetical protein
MLLYAGSYDELVSNGILKVAFFNIVNVFDLKADLHRQKSPNLRRKRIPKKSTNQRQLS